MKLKDIKVKITGKHIRMDNDDQETMYWLRTDGEFAIPVSIDIFNTVQIGNTVDIRHDKKDQIHSAIFWL